jgi:hypothetical protein
MRTITAKMEATQEAPRENAEEAEKDWTRSSNVPMRAAARVILEQNTCTGTSSIVSCTHPGCS